MKKILYSKFWLVLWVLGFAFAGAQTKPAKPVSNGDKMYCKSDARFPDLSVQAPTDATVVATKWNLVAPIDAAIKNSITGLPIYKKGDIIPTLYDGSVPVNIEKTGLTYNFSDISNNSGQSSTPSTLTHSELTFAVWNENAAGVPSDYTFVKMSVETFPELTPDPLKTFCSIKENITLKVTPKTALKTGQQIVWYLDDNDLSFSSPLGTGASFVVPENLRPLAGQTTSFRVVVENAAKTCRSTPVKVSVQNTSTGTLAVTITTASGKPYLLTGESIKITATPGFSDYDWYYVNLDKSDPNKLFVIEKTQTNTLLVPYNKIDTQNPVVVTGSSPGKCDSSGKNRASFYVLDKDLDASLGENVDLCEGETVVLEPKSVPTLKTGAVIEYIWKKTPLGGGASVLLYPNNTPTFEAASEGIFSLEIIYKEQGVGTTSYYPPIRSVGQMKVNYTGLSIVKTPVKCTSQTILTTNSEFKPVTITVDGRQFTDQVDFKQFETGVYQVSLEDSFGCTLEKEVDFVKNISVPTYFSPNGDNINDTWQPNLADCGSKVRIAIYDRYAHLVFTGGPTDPWDGTKNGVEMPEGDYWFIARFNDSEQQLLKGNITLKRR